MYQNTKWIFTVSGFAIISWLWVLFDITENQNTCIKWLLQHCLVNRCINRFSRMLYHRGMSAYRGHEEKLHSFQKSTLHFCSLFFRRVPFHGSKQTRVNTRFTVWPLTVNLFFTLTCIVCYIFRHFSQTVAKNGKSCHHVSSSVHLFLRMEHGSFYDLWYSIFEGPGSSIGIATGYELDGPGIESRWGRDLPHLSIPALGPIQPPVQWLPDLSRG
jgi:hypothetical protein